MKSTERWYATRRESLGKFFRILGQPQEGFANIEDVRNWLIDSGYIEIIISYDNEPAYLGWGDKYFASASWRNDPWEPEINND